MKKSSKSEVIGACGCWLFLAPFLALLFGLGFTAVYIAISAIQGETVFANPPIELSVAGNTSNEHYLTVDNKSNNRIFCTLHMTSRSAPKKTFWIGSRSSHDSGFGLFSYDYENGDCGYIEVEGYSRKLYFQLNDDNTYRTAFGWFGLWW